MAAQRITGAVLRRWPLPSPEAAASKEDRGRVLVVGGSRQVPGAIALTGEAALRAGAGKLMMLTLADHVAGLGVAMPEAAVVGVAATDAGELDALSTSYVGHVRAASAVVVGPGMATAASPVSVQVARAARAVVLDAGSLHTDAVQAARGRAVLTPHVGEMADLMGVTPAEVARHAEALAQVAADRFDAVVVLKGPTTWIAAPGRTRWVHHVDAPGLGTSGSGDVMAGVLAGLLARGADPVQAAVWAVALHARAGVIAGRRIGTVGYLARELLPTIPRLLDRLR
ncbi:NAD(P)H-hydrate dehydratase [Luteibacter sp. 9135]|uniref:NAD(P)H-hydrate dehydratase n=1 Tax=Luteibacter sp. 9135 TaxID=1500893 RepID=UPI000565F305|nr:NAD(P)H-hydrate dehydratase [Luteibacter sp. 9135]